MYAMDLNLEFEALPSSSSRRAADNFMELSRTAINAAVFCSDPSEPPGGGLGPWEAEEVLKNKGEKLYAIPQFQRPVLASKSRH